MLVLVAAGWVTTTSCSDRIEPRRLPDRAAELQISASLAGMAVSTLVVTVSAPDMQSELIFNIDVVDGVASGTMALPVGTGRTVLVRAVGASGVTTHEGSKLVDVIAGVNPAVSITLLPLVGDQPIDVRIGNLVLRVTPGQNLVASGQTLALSAVVTDLNGAPVPGVKPADIRWASFDTKVATVNQDGTVTGESIGDVQIVASYAGAAGAARISVGPLGEPVLAAGDIARCDPMPDAPKADSGKTTAVLLDALDGLVLALGDNAYESGTLNQYNNCYNAHWGRHKGRTRPVPGNHEYKSRNAVGYFTYFAANLSAFGDDSTKGYYSYNVGAWHIIALNSERKPIVDPVTKTSPQLEWLKADLAKPENNKKCVLAYWHRPLFNSGAHHGNEPDIKPFWDALYAAGADVVLVGHEHLYERFGPQRPDGVPDAQAGIRQFTVGTGGAELYEFDPIRKPNSEFGFMQDGILALVLGDDAYSWRFITGPDGVVRDLGVGTCH